MRTFLKSVAAVAAVAAFVTAAATAIVSPGTLAAQAPRYHPASDPAAIAILERSIKAGGTGTQPEFSFMVQEMQVPGSPAMRTEISTARPGKVHMKTSIGGQVMMEFGFDGTTGWSRSPMTGVQVLAGPQLEAMRAGAASSVSAPSFDSTARLVAAGRTTLEGEAVDRILTVSAEGDTVEVYFTVATGLLAGMRTPAMPASSGGPPEPTLMLLRDYKPFGGSLMPVTITMRMGAVETVARTIQMDNDPISAERFRKP